MHTKSRFLALLFRVCIMRHCVPRSLISQLARFAGVPVSSITTALLGGKGMALEASISFPAGSPGLIAAVLLVRALELNVTLLPTQPLSHYNFSNLLVAVVEEEALTVS